MALFEVATPQGIFSARPAADTTKVGRLYYSTDTEQLFRDNGTTWDEWVLGGGGSGGGGVEFSFSGTVNDSIDTDIFIDDVTGSLAGNFDISDTEFIVITPDSAGQYMVQFSISGTILAETSSYYIQARLLRSNTTILDFGINYYHPASPTTNVPVVIFGQQRLVVLEDGDSLNLSIYQNSDDALTVTNVDGSNTIVTFIKIG